MKREILTTFTRALQNIWAFYDKKIRSYQLENYSDIDVSKPLPGEAMNVLRRCCQALNDRQVNYFLAWGTALGLHRDKQLIAHDNDLDIDIFDYENFEVIITALENAGMKLARKVWHNRAIQQLVFLSSEGVIVDLVFWRRKNNYFATYCEPGYVLKIPENLVASGRRPIRPDEPSLLSFAAIEEYLKTIYGSDWMTPKSSKGDWKDDCCIVFRTFDPVWHSYQKIAPFYLKLKNRLYPPSVVPERFLELNKDFWPDIPRYDKYFLVDLTIHDHEYYNIHLITARALSEILKAKPVILLPKRQSGEVASLVRSYGIEEIIYLENYEVAPLLQLGLFLKALYLWLIKRTKESLLAAEFNGTVVGHLIYDEYLGYTRYGTVRMWDPTLVKIIFRSLKYYYKYRNIFNERKYELYFGVEQIYASAGMASIAATSQGIRMLLRKYGPNKVAYKSYRQASDLDLFSSHPEKEDFEYQLKYNSEAALAWSDDYIKKLFQGDVDKDDWNAKNAFAAASPIKPEDYERMFRGDYRYCVFIFSHVFIDAVHCYRQGLFPDYEVWLRETLKIAAARTDTLWIIKPHPSDKFYPTKHTSLNVYQDFKKYDNIRMFPADTSAANLVDKIDAIVTFRGTAAGEYSCMGVPAIIAGRGMFDEGEFCLAPKDRAEYKDVLMNYQFKRLPADAVRRAKIYLYVYNHVNRVAMPLLDDISLVSAHSAVPEEIYRHLSRRISEYRGTFSFPDDYRKYFIKKLN